jgi:hypothetical protein
VLFTFPSRYLCTIGRQGVFRLGGWSPHVQTRFHVPRPTRSTHQTSRLRGYHPLWPTFPDGSAYSDASNGLIRVRSPLLTESLLMSFPPGTEMFQFPGFASYTLCIQGRIPLRVGFPIRTSADQRSLASPRGFSQRATSFFASWRQGIHRTLLSRSIHHQRPYAGPSPTSKHQQLNQKNAQQLTLSIQPIRFTCQTACPSTQVPKGTTGQKAISLCSVNAAWVTTRPQPRCNQLPWRRSGSNRRPPACKAGALPLSYAPENQFQERAAGQAPQQPSHKDQAAKGRQLSPKGYPKPKRYKVWAREDLNLRPHAYQACALTN